MKEIFIQKTISSITDGVMVFIFYNTPHINYVKFNLK